MRLIDADELKMNMHHEAFETDTYMQKWDGGCWIRYQLFENVINSTQTVNTVPVKHGHWTITSQIDSVRGCWARCSNCNTVLFGGGRYCGNCGALMDEEIINDD